MVRGKQMCIMLNRYIETNIKYYIIILPDNHEYYVIK